MMARAFPVMKAWPWPHHSNFPKKARQESKSAKVFPKLGELVDDPGSDSFDVY
jgi:hypothetical protein